MSDRQLSPLAVSALGIFWEGPNHPYEVYRLMRHRREDRVVKVRPGTLYHTIDKLAADGLLQPVGVDRDGNRPERTTYAITDAGRVLLRRTIRDMLARPVYEYPRFPVAAAEAHNLDRDDALAALRERVETLTMERDLVDRAIEETLRLSIPPVLWLEVSCQRAHLAAEIGWLERTIAAVESGEIDWSARPGAPHTDDARYDCFDIPTPLFPDLMPRKAR